MKYLYHFTSEEAFESIKRDGYIRPMIFEGTIDTFKEPLIWLSSDGIFQNILARDIDTKIIRLTIDTKNLEYCSVADLSSNSLEFSYQIFVNRGGLDEFFCPNLIVRHEISFEDVIEARNIRTGKVYYSKDGTAKDLKISTIAEKLEYILKRHIDEIKQVKKEDLDIYDYRELICKHDRNSKRQVLEIIWFMIENAMNTILKTDKSYKNNSFKIVEGTGKSVDFFINQANEYKKDGSALKIMHLISAALGLKNKAIIIKDIKETICVIQKYCVDIINQCNENPDIVQIDSKLLSKLVENYKINIAKLFIG